MVNYLMENTKEEIKVEYIIYKITNTKNNKIYIGKTKTHHGNGKKYGIHERFKKHCHDATIRKFTQKNY